MSEGIRALFLVAGSTLAGTVYVLYLRAEPFPPDIVRVVPVAWLGGSLLGGVRAAQALRRNSSRWAAVLALALHVPSVIFAAIFAMAALLGD